jgi:GGDEF domain-containing protein
MEAILDKMRVDWLKEQACTENQQAPQVLTVLQTLENHSDDDEEMSGILSKVRSKVESGEIGENDFSRIYAEIDQYKQQLKEKADEKNLNSDILQSSELLFLLDKEIAKTKRYQTSFSVLAFSFVSAKPKIKIAKNVLSNKAILEAALDELVQDFREVDFVGQIGKNKLLVILPMTHEVGAKVALSRVLKTLHAEPLMVNKIPVQLRVAGVAAVYEPERSQDARAFARQLSNQLMDMAARVKNIQVLF